MKNINIVIFNNYIDRKKFFIKSNINCDNKIKLIDKLFLLKNIDYSSKKNIYKKENYNNYKINYNNFIN